MSAKPNDRDVVYRLSVAVEGPCCAGKTTLSRGLLADLDGLVVSHVKCYADHVGGGRFLPRPVPETALEDTDGLEVLLTIEADRVAHARSTACDLVLIDRSVYTLLAHRYALEQVTSLKCFATAERVLAESDVPLWPDLVIYLDVSQEAVHERNRGKFPVDSIFIDADFNTGVRGFFSRLAERGEQKILWLDATLEPAKLINLAETQIRELARAI